MRTDRRQNDDGGGGVYQRSAGRKVISGGTRRRGQDQAIGPVFVHPRTIGEDGESAHAEDVAGFDDEIVEREGERLVGETDFEQGAFF